MCNCAGVQFSNCVGNPECDCQGAYTTNSSSSKAEFNNMVGVNGFVNATGEIQTLTTPSIQLQTTIPTIKLPTTTAPTSSTSSTSGQTLNKVLDLSSSVLGLFGKKSTPVASGPVILPTEEKTIPTAVWVVVGGLLLLVVTFVIVKAAKK